MDNLYFFVTAITAFFALMVVLAVVIAAIRHRDHASERVGAPIRGSIRLEIVWSIIPFFISMAIFGWSTAVFLRLVRAPDQTLQLCSTGTEYCGSTHSGTIGRASR